MSLVNDMLRDLEQRRGEGEGDSTPLAAAPAQPRSRRFSPWLLVLALGVSGALAWLLLNPVAEPGGDGFQPRQATVVTPEVAVVLEPAGKKTPPAAAAESASQPRPVVVVPELPLPRVASETEKAAPPKTVPVEPVDKADTAVEAKTLAAAPAASKPVQRSEVAAPASLPVAPLSASPAERPQVVAPATPPSTKATPDASMAAEATGLQKTPRWLGEQQDARQAAEVRRLLRAGEKLKAETQLLAYLAANPETPAPLSRALLASLLIEGQQWEQATERLDVGLALSPDHPGLKRLKARVLLRQGAAEAAAELLSRAPPPLASDIAYHQLLAAALQTTGDHGQAASVYLQLLRLDSVRPAWWLGLGLSLEALGSLEQARQAYRNLLLIPTTDPATDPALSRHARQRLGLLGG